MEKSFQFLGELSLAFTVIICIILGMKRVFRDNGSVHFHYFIWGILLLKLYLPTYFYPFSPAVERWIIYIVHSYVGQVGKGIVIGWLLVCCMLLLIFISVMMYTRWRLKVYIPHPLIETLTIECKKQLGLRRHVRVICSPYYRTPFVFGFFKPVVVIPYALVQKLTKQQLQLIFLHECIHIKRFDYIYRHLMSIQNIIHWYNPFLWYASYVMAKDCEKSCDDIVVKVSRDRKVYRETLIDVAIFSTQYDNRVYGLSFSKEYVKERVNRIMRL